MIIPKKKLQADTQEVVVPEKVQIPKNGLIAVYHAIKEILEKVRWDYYDPNSEKIFKTVMMNRGQFERIIRKGGNSEYALGFPAAFVEFTNWRYLVQQQRINEGRANMQIKFVMNRLNNQDPDTFDKEGNVKEYRETEVEYVAQIINQFIQELKYNYPALSERINLTYIDPLESFDNSLQPCWITYEVWFREESIYATRWLKNTYIVFPPYTNHSDQEKEQIFMAILIMTIQNYTKTILYIWIKFLVQLQMKRKNMTQDLILMARRMLQKRLISITEDYQMPILEPLLRQAFLPLRRSSRTIYIL